MAPQTIADQAVSAVLQIYNWLTSFLSWMLQQTIFKARPDLADQFASAFSLMISITAVYILLLLVSAFKKIVGVVLAIGWVALILAIALYIARP